MKELLVVKVGGNVIDDEGALAQFLKQFAQIKTPKILIHGGGKIATSIGEKLGLKTKMIEGRRVTTAETLDLVTMVYAGLLNKKIVAGLQGSNCNAIGFTGADGNLLKAKLRSKEPIDFGFAGDVEVDGVNIELLKNMFETGLVPVISAITHDGSGQLLNTNADTMASILAQACAPQFMTNLIYLFEKKGVLSDLEKEIVIDKLNSQEADVFSEKGIIHQGMLPKLKNAFEAKTAGVSQVRIGHYKELGKLILNQKGTEIL